MDTLADIIGLLNDTDKKRFKQFLMRKNKREDVKNVHLFDLIDTDDIPSLNKMLLQWKNRDAYHALRKRLQDSLLLFLSQRAFEDSHSDTYEVLRLVVVGRFLLENDLAKVAFKCLDKAERLALQLDQFNLLNELLLLKLQYAHLPEAEPLDALSLRFLHNQENMQREAKLHMAYAFLRTELQAIQLQGKIVQLSSLIITTIRKYRIGIKELMTYKSIYQILFIANEYAAIQQNYTLIERYIKRAHCFMEDQPEQKPAHLFYRISIAYFLANFQLRRKDFDRSKAYLQEMMELMGTTTRYYRIFYLRHQLLCALNLYFCGQADAAIRLSQETLSTVKSSDKAEDVADVRLALTMFMAQCNDRLSLRQLSLLTHTDAWYEKKLGMLWTIRKNLMEILVHAQFENIELALSRIGTFRRRYKKYLQSTAEGQVLYYLDLVEKSLLKPDVVFLDSFQAKVWHLLENPANQDIFNASFIAWLMARWQKKTAYQVSLDLVCHTRKDREGWVFDL
ncbi:hypothetical protein [Sphingobacterium griseoflavum]|uniref:Tetratricopeptide repeat protein n=1 Tax=Sphingobacterium griseoflavum TaxID=1474952 RepID=A0ABQ3I1Q0_9SPHI|nr:hypothetical protein [Sphingobacterium griseoflavum]GHE49231.1 hypothetical protein GCM10017764_35340 [Sphingobacterium griseoflavum]